VLGRRNAIGSSVLAIALALAACGGATGSSGGGGGAATAGAPGSSGAPAATSGTGAGACGTTDPTGIIRAAAKAQLAAPSYESSTTSELNPGGSSTSVLDYQSPNSVHMTITSASGKVTERIQVGSKGWMKVGSTWVEAPALDIKPILAGAGTFADTVVLSNVAVVGHDTIDGAAATSYSFKADLGAGIGTSAGTMWIRDADCLPVKQDATSSTTLSGATVSAHTVTTVTKYGQVTVTAPA